MRKKREKVCLGLYQISNARQSMLPQSISVTSQHKLEASIYYIINKCVCVEKIDKNVFTKFILFC